MTRAQLLGNISRGGVGVLAAVYCVQRDVCVLYGNMHEGGYVFRRVYGCVYTVVDRMDGLL